MGAVIDPEDRRDVFLFLFFLLFFEANDITIVAL